MGLSSNQIIFEREPLCFFCILSGPFFWDTQIISNICHVSSLFNQDQVTEGQKRSQKEMLPDEQLSYVLSL